MTGLTFNKAHTKKRANVKKKKKNIEERNMRANIKNLH